MIDWLVSVLQDEKKLEEGLEKYQADQAAAHAPLTEELEKTRKVVDKQQGKLDRLLDLYLDGDMDKSLFVGKEKELKKDIADGNERIAEIEEKLERVLLTPGRIANIKHFAAEFREGAEELPNKPEAQKELLVAADVQVWITPLPHKKMKIKVIAAIGETDDASNIGIDNTLSKQSVDYSKAYLSAEFIV